MTVEEKYKQILVEIEKRIKTAKPNSALLSQLESDKKLILNCLYPELYKLSPSCDLNIKETKDEISSFVINHQLYFCPLSGVCFINKNNRNIEKLFNNFINEDIFGLKKVYEEIISNDGLTYVESSHPFWGKNLFLSSLKRNLIEIRKSNKLYEATSLVHELGHAKTNVECNGIPKTFKNNSFLESYSIFLELVFADYLKDNGLKKEGFELKLLTFRHIKNLIKTLYEQLEEYKNSDEKRRFDYFYEKSYKSLKSYYLSLHFYFLYKANQKDALKIINSFIKEIKLLDDNEIIKKFNLNKKCFSNDNVYKLYRELSFEKSNIKRK